MTWWNGDFCIENEDRNHMIWWKGDNEGEDQTCSLCRWDQAPWKCGQAVREQSLPGEQSPWNQQYYNDGQLSLGCLQSEVLPQVLPGSVVGHSCWTFGSDYRHSWKYTVLIFSFKLSGQSDIWRNISAAITYQCIRILQIMFTFCLELVGQWHQFGWQRSCWKQHCWSPDWLRWCCSCLRCCCCCSGCCSRWPPNWTPVGWRSWSWKSWIHSCLHLQGNLK